MHGQKCRATTCGSAADDNGPARCHAPTLARWTTRLVSHVPLYYYDGLLFGVTADRTHETLSSPRKKRAPSDKRFEPQIASYGSLSRTMIRVNASCSMPSATISPRGPRRSLTMRGATLSGEWGFRNAAAEGAGGLPGPRNGSSLPGSRIIGVEVLVPGCPGSIDLLTRGQAGDDACAARAVDGGDSEAYR